MKYLLDIEILAWNRRLEKSDYSVYPISNKQSAEPYLSFRQNVSPSYNTPHGIPNQSVVTVDPFIRYQFTFSIASNRVSNFNDLFEKLCKEPFGSKSIFSDLNNEKIYEIKFSDEVIDSKEESKHIVLEKEYVRYTYNFAGKLGSIMAYISYLEDAINFFNEIWGYNEDGSEVCLLKYPISTCVSTIDNKSVDYLVLDYKYSKYNGKYYIDYVAAEMLNTNKSILTYGNVNTFSEDRICYSRNSRIDDILN
jgi:hypothetical protein